VVARHGDREVLAALVFVATSGCLRRAGLVPLRD
jgi:hypothetical protein